MPSTGESESLGSPASAPSAQALAAAYCVAGLEPTARRWRKSTIKPQAETLRLLNNLVLLHGREAFTPEPGHSRLLKRLWLRRQHLFAGDDPAALDLEEYS